MPALLHQMNTEFLKCEKWNQAKVKNIKPHNLRRNTGEKFSLAQRADNLNIHCFRCKEHYVIHEGKASVGILLLCKSRDSSRKVIRRRKCKWG